MTVSGPNNEAAMHLAEETVLLVCATSRVDFETKPKQQMHVVKENSYQFDFNFITLIFHSFYFIFINAIIVKKHDCHKHWPVGYCCKAYVG